ncbi:hypothetical protein SPRG_19438 [Saprolegnia parasitica CBS 223.65]|uniref:Uncharacterized protein n=1 Tax=Saprolegnia parasitica (strain CBS 223.65) TaxID=695850 RepID=A0A067CQC5_SAPPC|nr:hypothetical protein SPRG_19438 [Saprolegnia parasitica CBS 223.65]KDO32909.1 hypothetical protein SPRG_19438 [Saprolegnia parasitica CBS 223.65]|eukprot:XP_012196668.1 hypothetical protein SPRG_19438 [Saprolegnia parasitica CBS 223.65]
MHLRPLTKSPGKAPPPLGPMSGSPRKQRMLAAAAATKVSDVRAADAFSANDLVSILPGNYAACDANGTGTLHDILLFDQKLRDATAAGVHLDATQWTSWDMARANRECERPVDTASLRLLTSNKLTLEILTSDRGHRVIPSLIAQWDQDKFSDNGLRLWNILDTFFNSLPYVFVRADEVHTKLVVRYTSAMAQLKTALADALFCSNPSVAAAVTASLAPSHCEKLPLYHYCHQLEREIQMLKNSSADQSWEMVHATDVGLMQDATARLLLEYWKLPKRERLAFLAQIFTHISEMEIEIVQLLLETSTFVLRRALEELGYESKQERQARHVHTMTSLVAKSVTATLEAKKLRLQNEAKRKELEPISLRHKGIQVNMDDDLLPAVMSPPQTPKESLYSPRRFVANREKSLHLLAEHKAGKESKNRVLVKDLWTVAALTDNLIHHLSTFVDTGNDKHNVPLQVLSMSSLLLEWLRFEKTRAVSSAKDATMTLHANPHYKQCMVHMLQLFMDHDHAPLSIKTEAQALQDYILNQRAPAHMPGKPPCMDEEALHAAPSVHPSDVRNFLKLGFPAEIASHLVTIASDTTALEKQSHLILLMEQLERYTRDTLHKPSAKPLGFGDRPLSSEASLLDKIKGLIATANEENREAIGHQAAALVLGYTTTSRKPSSLASGHMRTLDAESVCHVLLTKLEHEMQTGPLQHSTRRELTRLHSLVATFVHADDAPSTTEALLAPDHIQNSISWLGALLAQALLQKASLGPSTCAILDALHSLLVKTQAKMHGASVHACLATMVNALQLANDKKVLSDFIQGLDDLQATLKALLQPLGATNVPWTKPQEAPWAMSDAAIDAVVTDVHVDATPVCIVQLANELRTLHEANVAAATAPKPRPNLFPGLMALEKDKGRRPHVLGISVAELSEMFSDNKVVLNLSTVLKLLYQIYRERYECNLSDQDSVGSTAFIDFVYDWYLRKYGLRKLAMQHLAKLLLSLKKHRKHNKKCLLFSRFLGVELPAYEYGTLNFALGLLHLWTNGSFLLGANASTKMPLATLLPMLEDSYDKRFGPFCSTEQIKAKVTAKACVDDASLIDQDAALEIALDEFGVMQGTVETMLLDIYAAGDVLGHDDMGYDEFSIVLHDLAPCISDRDTARLYRDAVADFSLGTVPRARFVAVILDNGVLSTRQNKFKASGAAYPTEYEDDQFAALDETWQATESDLLAAVQRIPHAETAASLNLRVRILKMIIAKKIDSETAWVAYRTIVRDVNRFRDLQPAEIAAIKAKETTFKDAVARLTSVKFKLLRKASTATHPTATSSRSPSSSVVAFVNDLDENALETDAAPAVVAQLEEKLRDELLRLSDAPDASKLEATLDSYGVAVQKVRRVNEKYAKILRRVTVAMKALAPATTTTTESDDAYGGDEQDR